MLRLRLSACIAARIAYAQFRDRVSLFGAARFQRGQPFCVASGALDSNRESLYARSAIHRSLGNLLDRTLVNTAQTPQMWTGTPYAHIMVPTTSMAKSVSKAPAEKKAADENETL